MGTWRRTRWLVIALLVAAFAVVGGLAVLLWAVPTAGPQPITSCRTALEETDWCVGLDASWTECRWSFHAEGRPHPRNCTALLQHGTRPREPQELASFRGVPCETYRLPKTLRCFLRVHGEPEALHLTLWAFDPECRRGVVLRSCNHPLRTYEAPTGWTQREGGG